MSSSFPSSSFLQHPAFSSDPSSNPFGINWQSNPSYAKSTSSSSDSGHSSAHSSYTSSSSTSSSGSDMPSLSVLPNPTLAMKKKKKQPQLSEAPSSKVANPVMSHPPLTRSRSSLFRQKGNPLDRIDELDETSMAGLLHHQGPYEAAKKISNQHRLPPGLNVERHIDEVRIGANDAGMYTDACYNSITQSTCQRSWMRIQRYAHPSPDRELSSRPFYHQDETIPRRRAAKAAKKSFKVRYLRRYLLR